MGVCIPLSVSNSAKTVMARIWIYNRNTDKQIIVSNCNYSKYYMEAQSTWYYLFNALAEKFTFYTYRDKAVSQTVNVDCIFVLFLCFTDL